MDELARIPFPLGESANLIRFRLALRERLARQMSMNIWGNGFRFNALDEDIKKKFEAFNQTNRLIEIMAQAERQLSMAGRAIVTLNMSEKGEVLLNLPNLFFWQGMSKSMVTPTQAVIWQRFELDDRMYILKSTYTTYDVRNDWFVEHDQWQVITFGERAKLDKAFQVKPYWKHNLGFVPVVEFTNIAYPFGVYWNTQWEQLSDWATAEFLEPQIYTAFMEMMRELILCHSYISMTQISQQVADEMNKNLNNLFSMFEGAATGGLRNFVISASGPDNDIKPIPGTSDSTKYTKTIYDLLDMYFKLAGSSRFSEGGGAQKTVSETSQVKANLNELVAQKITHRTRAMRELIYKALRMMGIGEDKANKFVFKIQPNINKDDLSYIQIQQELLNANVITSTDIVQDYYGIDNDFAQELYEHNKEINQQAMMEQMDGIQEKPHDKTMDGMGNHLNDGGRFS